MFMECKVYQIIDLAKTPAQIGKVSGKRKKKQAKKRDINLVGRQIKNRLLKGSCYDMGL